MKHKLFSIYDNQGSLHGQGLTLEQADKMLDNLSDQLGQPKFLDLDFEIIEQGEPSTGYHESGLWLDVGAIQMIYVSYKQYFTGHIDFKLFIGDKDVTELMNKISPLVCTLARQTIERELHAGA
jgi:hypothetical protein